MLRKNVPRLPFESPPQAFEVFINSWLFQFISNVIPYDLFWDIWILLLYKPICGFFTFDVGLCPNCYDLLYGMRWHNP